MAAPVLLRWHADPVVVTGLTVLVVVAVTGVRRAVSSGATVSAARRRYGVAAVVTLVVALVSPLAALAEERFTAHMVQHLLLTYGAAPLLALAAPVTLVLQAAGSTSARRRVLGVLHSRPVRAVSHPVIAWALFAAVMYLTHFSPLYDAALGNPLLHGLEHLLYLGSAALFWWPVVRRDPVPGQFSWPARLLYLVLAMPYQSLLGLAIYSSDTPMYPHYARLLGPVAAVADQQLAGAVMWVGGDLLMLGAIAFALGGWFRSDARETERLDARLDAARAAAAGTRKSP